MQRMFLYLRYWQTRTHCCGHIVADTNVSPFARSRNICGGHKICVRNKCFPVCAAWKHNIRFVSRAPKKHHEQQCVRNNVSSSASTLMCKASKTNCLAIAFPTVKQARENFENTREINPKLPSGPIFKKKLPDSDWLREVQLKCNTGAINVTPVRITHRNSRLRFAERQWKIF